MAAKADRTLSSWRGFKTDARPEAPNAKPPNAKKDSNPEIPISEWVIPVVGAFGSWRFPNTAIGKWRGVRKRTGEFMKQGLKGRGHP